MATETQEIVPVDGTNGELVENETKVEYSVKSEVISTMKTHETVTYVTEVRTESETVENHVQESTTETTEEVTIVQNGDSEEKNGEEETEVPEAEPEKPKENGDAADESPATEEPKVEANIELNVEATPAETAENAEAVEAAEPSPEIEEEPPKVVLHQLPPMKEIVSRSPQCLALETFIKMSGIPYENEYEEKAQDVTKENKGKIPYIVYKRNKVEGLKNCIDFLKKKFEIETDKHILPTDEAVAHAFSTMIEESTYWSLIYYRWVDNYGESKKMFSKLPPVLNVVSPKMFQNKCKKSIESHVIGRYSREELYNIAEQDLNALAAFLAEKAFFLGEQPSSIDAVIFGLLANFEYGTVGSPQQNLIREKLTNLHDFNARMKEKYWSDWDEICGAEKFQDKPKASLVKRLSFRGNKKSKKPPKEEGEKSEPTSPESDEPKEAGESKENGEMGEENPQQNGEAEANESEDKKDESEDKKDEGDDKKDEAEKPDETPKDEGEKTD